MPPKNTNMNGNAAKAKVEQEAKDKAETEAKAKAEQEAKSKTEAEAKAKAEQEAKDKADAENQTSGQFTTVVVIGPKKGRWRIGRHFGSEPTKIPVEDLNEDQVKALRDDLTLAVSVI